MKNDDYQINGLDSYDLEKLTSPKPNVSINAKSQNQKPKQGASGLLIGGIICFALSLVLLLVTGFMLYQTLKDATGDAQGAITFIVFILSYGWLTYLPGIILSLVALFLNAFAIKSDFKGQKVSAIIFTILSVFIFIAYVFIGVFVTILPSM